MNHPGARLGDRFFCGSGTSRAAAIMSGAAALVLQRYPYATPDQVKGILKGATISLPLVNNSRKMGTGELQLDNASWRLLPTTGQSYYAAQGTGSLEKARGTDHLTRDGVVLTGEQDWSGNSWSGVSWSADAWSGNSWSGNSWSTTDWSGNSWSGNSWSGDDWATGCWC